MIGKPTSRPVRRLLVESTSVGDVKREVNFFITNGTKGVILTKVEGWIDSVRPGSVEAERWFLAAGFFATKLRSRMEDELLSALKELRAYFNAEAK